MSDPKTTKKRYALMGSMPIEKQHEKTVYDEVFHLQALVAGSHTYVLFYTHDNGDSSVVFTGVPFVAGPPAKDLFMDWVKNFSPYLRETCRLYWEEDDTILQLVVTKSSLEVVTRGV